YDASKFGWIGSSTTSNTMVYTWYTTGVKTLAYAMEKEGLMGGTGIGSNSGLYPTRLKNALGTKVKLVLGYSPQPGGHRRMERGEVQGRAGESFNTLRATNPGWLAEHKVNLLVQIGIEADAGFPDVPMLAAVGRDEAARAVLRVFSEDVALGRPYLAPPGIP